MLRGGFKLLKDLLTSVACYSREQIFYNLFKVPCSGKLRELCKERCVVTLKLLGPVAQSLVNNEYRTVEINESRGAKVVFMKKRIASNRDERGVGC